VGALSCLCQSNTPIYLAICITLPGYTHSQGLSVFNFNFIDITIMQCKMCGSMHRKLSDVLQKRHYINGPHVWHKMYHMATNTIQQAKTTRPRCIRYMLQIRKQCIISAFNTTYGYNNLRAISFNEK